MLTMTARRLRNFAIDLRGARPAIICRLRQLFQVPQYVYCYTNRVIFHRRQPFLSYCLTHCFVTRVMFDWAWMYKYIVVNSVFGLRNKNRTNGLYFHGGVKKRGIHTTFIVIIHLEIRGDLFRLISCSLKVLSFSQSQGWNGTAASEKNAQYNNELLPNFLIPQLTVTIKCGKNDAFSKKNDGWKGGEEHMIRLTIRNMLQ